MQELVDKLLLDYAAGTLSAEESLLVAALSVLNPQARKRVARYEALGGCVLEEESSAAVGCLEAVLQQIDSRCSIEDYTTPPLPEPLSRLLSGCAVDETACWRPARRGVARMTLRVSTHAKGILFLMRIAPQTAVPAHRHDGIEITLVLEGSFTDLSRTYRRGDVAMIADTQLVHSPRAGEDGCLCLVFCTAPLRFMNPVYRLLGVLR